MKTRFRWVASLAAVAMAAAGLAVWLLAAPQPSKKPSALDKALLTEQPPERIRTLLLKDRPYAAVEHRQLLPSDREVLHRLYRAAETFRDKARLARGLAMVGNDESAELLIGTLTRNYRAAQFPKEEEAKLQSLVVTLGFLSHNSNRAFEFLKLHAYSNAWASAIKWRPREPPAANNLTWDTLRAIGLSGRPETLAALQEITSRRQALGGAAGSFDSAGYQMMCDLARYYCAYTQKYGYDKLRESWSKVDDDPDRIHRWLKTGWIDE